MLIVDNKIQIAKIKLAYIVTFPIGLLLVISPVFNIFNQIESIVSMIIGCLLLLSFIILLLIKPQYLYFAIENNSKIVIRIYHAFPILRKYKVFEISLSNLKDFEIKESFFGQLKSIQFSVLSKNKIGKYPWISLNAVSEKEITSLRNFLNKIIPSVKQKK